MVRSSFVRSVLTLVSGTAVAQLVTVGVSPLLSRLYGPEDFGGLALFVSLTTVGGAVATLQYAAAILLPEEETEAHRVAALSVALVCLTTLGLLVLVAFWRQEIAHWIRTPRLSTWLWLAPVGVALRGSYDVLNFYATRQRKFRAMATSQVAQAMSGNGVKLLMGWLRGAGLAGQVGGQLAGQCLAVVTLAAQAGVRTLSRGILGVSVRALLKVAARYRKFPLFLCWATLLNQLSTQLPPLLLARFFSPAVVGFYYLSDRLLGLPVATLGSAVSRVFFQRAAAERQAQRNPRRIVSAAFRGLFLLGAPAMVLLALCGPALFSWAFGSPWREAGEYVRVLAPLYLLKFSVSPLTSALTVAEKQEITMGLQVLYLVLVVGAFWWGGSTGSARTTLALFAAGASIRYLLELFCCCRYSTGVPEANQGGTGVASAEPETGSLP